MHKRLKILYFLNENLNGVWYDISGLIMEKTGDMSLSARLSELPREVVRSEIIPRIGRIGMIIVRLVLLGIREIARPNDDDPVAYQHGLVFYKWCRKYLRFTSHINVGRWGCYDIVDWLIKNYQITGICDGAALGGRLDMLMYAWTRGCKFSSVTATNAIVGKSLDCLKWLHEMGCPDGEYMCGTAITSGSLDILQWLHEKGYKCGGNACCIAARYGWLDILKWLRNNGMTPKISSCKAAVIDDHLEVLQWLHGIGCRPDEGVVLYAAEHGSLKCLKWLRTEGLWSDKVCTSAAKHGRIDVLRWLHFVGHKWHRRVCMLAIAGGHRNCLELLVDYIGNACLNKTICLAAVTYDRLEILEWLRSVGCKWDLQACVIAAKRSSPACLEYLRKYE